MDESDKFRVIVFQDGGSWVAQCLEYDIGAQARDLEELQDRFELAFNLELKKSIEKNGAPFAGIAPAPQYVQDMWEKRSGEFRPTRMPKIKEDGPQVTFDMALCA